MRPLIGVFFRVREKRNEMVLLFDLVEQEQRKRREYWPNIYTRLALFFVFCFVLFLT